jgi:anti-sigma B factor antagonist
VRGLSVEAGNGGGDVLLSLQGEIDLATAPKLEAALERALRDSARRVLVDLRGVEFMDSSGLSLLVRHDRLARSAARRLVLIKGPPQVHQVFELTRLTEHLTIVDDPPE